MLAISIECGVKNALVPVFQQKLPKTNVKLRLVYGLLFVINRLSSQLVRIQSRPAYILFFLMHHTVWATGQRDPGRGWSASATQTLVNHLKGCSLQPEDIRQAAEAHMAAQKSNFPYRQTHQNGISTATFPGPVGPSAFVSNHATPPLLHATTLSAPSTSFSPAISPITLNTPLEIPFPGPSPSPVLSELALSNLNKRRRISPSSRQSSVLSGTPWTPSQ